MYNSYLCNTINILQISFTVSWIDSFKNEKNYPHITNQHLCPF